MRTLTYNREKAIEYAYKYALNRNPDYYNFDSLGGNCTNFISQCIFAGSLVMNYTPVFGWYYISLKRRAPAWTGVNELYKFLTTNLGVGPFGIQTEKENALIGDIIQFANSSNHYYHTSIITKIDRGKIFVTTNTSDALNRPLEHYSFAKHRCIHILGVRKSTEE